MVQCNYQGAGGELAELRQYLASQLMWDPSRRPEAIRFEFCRGYYGPAADHVLAYLALMDSLSEDTNIHAFGAWDAQNTVPPSFVAEGLAILNAARAKAKDARLSNRIDKLLLPLWYMQLTYPERYGLAQKDGPALWNRFKKVVAANNITYICEGPSVREGETARWSSSPGIAGWIAAMDARWQVQH